MKTEQEETLSNLFISKSKTIKEMASIPHGYRCQNLEQNISKLNLALCTKSTISWPKEAYSKNARFS